MFSTGSQNRPETMLKSTFCDILKKYANFYDKALNETQVSTWYNVFKKYTPEIFDEAFLYHIKYSPDNWFPAIGVIGNIIGEKIKISRGDTEAQHRRILEETEAPANSQQIRELFNSTRMIGKFGLNLR